MTINYAPKLGQVLICDYSTGFVEPEMVKRRLAVVVSPRLQHRDKLCAVVPLSTTAPRSGIQYQCKIQLPEEPSKPFDGAVKWAKADMIATVSYARLNLPFDGKDRNSGKRKYREIVLHPDEMTKIHAAILHAIGLETLTAHLTGHIF